MYFGKLAQFVSAYMNAVILFSATFVENEVSYWVSGVQTHACASMACEIFPAALI